MTQIPGGIEPDFSDGYKVLDVFVDYLNGLNISEEKIEIEYTEHIMLNYKFKINIENSRLFVNLMVLYNILSTVDYAPFPIRELKSPVSDNKTALYMKIDDRKKLRVNMFQSGKINILGARSMESCELIYEFYIKLFTDNWEKLIKLKPIPPKVIAKRVRKSKKMV